MNLPNFGQENALKEQRSRMGADLRRWDPDGGAWGDIDALLKNKGIEIPLNEIEITGRGTFAHHGRSVAVYIRDQYGSREFASDPQKLRRVHVAECDTLKKMRDDDKFDVRYVVTTRTDGLYIVNFLGQYGSGDTVQGVECRLFVCINCLKRLNYKNYSAVAKRAQKAIKESFNLEEFFERYGSRIAKPPPQTDATAPPNTYTPDWEDVSLRCREKAHWRCSNCKDYFGEVNRRRFLHVHHSNGFKPDNSAQNLQVLCILCHAQIDERLKNSQDYSEYLRIKLKVTQIEL